MRRRFLLAALAVLPLAAFGLVNGCSSNDEPPVEDMCAWLGRGDNCYRDFNRDLGGKCGATGTAADPGNLDTVRGTFASRAALDICVLFQGGQVVFDPPINLAALPIKEPLMIKLNEPTGEECGSISYTSQYTFSVTINPPPDAGGSASGGGGAGGGTTSSGATTGGTGGGGTGGGTGGDASASECSSDYGADSNGSLRTYRSGTFVANTWERRFTMDVTCPAPSELVGKEEKHHFNRLQVEEKCSEYLDIVPQAFVTVNAGSTTQEGVVRVQIAYPPTDGSDIRCEKERVAPTIVTYAECSIPRAPLPCQDVQKNGLETDVDCGGSPTTEGCPRRCETGMNCLCTSDCVDGLFCKNDGMGALKCLEADAGAGEGIDCKPGQACECEAGQCATGSKCVTVGQVAGFGICSSDPNAVECAKPVVMDGGTDGGTSGGTGGGGTGGGGTGGGTGGTGGGTGGSSG